MATATAAAAVMKLNLSSDQTDDSGGEPFLYVPLSCPKDKRTVL